MIKYLLYLIIPLLYLPANAQTDTFNGRIIYDYEFLHPTTGEEITGVMKKYFGEEQNFFINAHNYQGFDENGTLRQLYHSKTNTYYFTSPNNGKLIAVDAHKMAAKVTSVTHSEETLEILGKPCKKLVVKTDTDETIYWYNPEISVDPAHFKNHNFGGWSTYIKASNGALPLKFVVKAQNYTWISTAVDIKEMELTNKDFDILEQGDPEKALSEKSGR